MKKLPVFEEITPPPSKLYTVMSRKWVARSPAMTVWDFIFAPGEEMPLHYHTTCYDIFFCLAGRMKVECVDRASGSAYEDTFLASGDATKVDAGIVHRPVNPYSELCRFLLIQGGENKDYVAYEGAPIRHS